MPLPARDVTLSNFNIHRIIYDMLIEVANEKTGGNVQECMRVILYDYLVEHHICTKNHVLHLLTGMKLDEEDEEATLVT